MLQTFPNRVNTLRLDQFGMNFTRDDVSRYLRMIKDRVTTGFSITGATMGTRNLQQLLEFGDHLSYISLSGNLLEDDHDELDLHVNFPNLKSLNLEGLRLGEAKTEYLVDYLIQTHTVQHMDYLNVYQDGLEELLEDLDQRLQQAGFHGYFKKISNWASFVLFFKSIFI